MKKISFLLLILCLILVGCETEPQKITEEPETVPSSAPADRVFLRDVSIEGITYLLYSDNTAEAVEIEQASLVPKELVMPTYIDEQFAVISLADELFQDIVITEITLPEKLLAIGDRTFRHSAIERITIPDSVTKIGRDAFTSCQNLTEAHLGEGLITVPVGAFFSCPRLSRITLPQGLLHIEEEAFGDLPLLEEIQLPQGVESIGAYAFWKTGTESLSLSIPDSVKQIGANAFAETAFLKAQTDEFVIVGDGVLILYQGSKTSLNLPQTVKFISNAFDFSPVTDLTVPDSVTGVAKDAFAESRITTFFYSEENQILGSLLKK